MQKPKSIVLVLGLIVVPLLVFTFKRELPRSSGDVRSLFPAHSNTLTALNRSEETFGSTLVDSLLVPMPSSSSESESDSEPNEELEELSEIEERIATLNGVVTVLSPRVGLSRYTPPITLISGDGKWGRFLVEIDATLADEERALLDRELETITREIKGVRAGPFSASEAATRALQSESQIYAPLCFMLLIVVLYALTGHFRISLALMASPVICLLWVSAVLVMFDIRMSAVSQLVPPLLLAIGASYSVFVGMRSISNKIDGTGRPRGLVSGLSLAAITTFIGFFSLTFFSTPAVTQFGVILSVATALSAILSLTIAPALLNYPRDVLTKVNERLAIWNFLREKSFHPTLALVAVVTCLVVSPGMRHLFVNTSPMHFVPKHEKESILTAEEIFPGSHILGVHLTFPGALRDVDVQLIGSLEDALRGVPGSARIVGAADFGRWWNSLPEMMRESKDIQFGPPNMTDESRVHSRIFVETDLEGEALLTLASDVENRIRPLLLPHSDISYQISSVELVLAQQASALARGLLQSLVSAFGFVGLLLLLLFRSFPVTCFGLFASALPIAAIFGAIGFLSPELNLGAAMVAATALGMVSDNTFHLLCTWREGANGDLERALQLSSGPVIVTVVVVVIGFSPTIFSPILPVRQFGLFLGAALLLGVVMNLVLLPTLLKRFAMPRSGKA